MFTTSTATLVSIVAFALSLAVVVPTTAAFALCTYHESASATSCAGWAPDLKMEMSVHELTRRVLLYNTGVNSDCTNLVVNKTVRVFLLRQRVIRTGYDNALTH